MLTPLFPQSVGRPTTDVKLIRIDELAELGCCCFCSILAIANDDFLRRRPNDVAAVMRALKRGADYMHADPVKAWEELCLIKKQFRGQPFYARMYERCLPFMSVDLVNVDRDWRKVVAYCKRIRVCGDEFEANYTNDFIQWPLEAEPADPLANQARLVRSTRSYDEIGLLTCPVCRPRFRRTFAPTAACSRPRLLRPLPELAHLARSFSSSE